MKNTLLFVCVIVWMFTISQLSAAQSQPVEWQPAEEAYARDFEEINEQFDELAEGIDQQAAENEELQSRIEQHKELVAEREAEEEEAEFAQYQEMSQLMTEIEEATMRRLNVYGFFDFTFYKNFFYRHSGFHLFVHDNSAFAASNLNLYLQGELIDDVTLLTEVKFSYLPDGHTEEFEIENVPGTVYEPTDTMVRDPYTTEQFDQGGINIVRANLTYQPLDYFYIKVGRFITPYGIWNIDHGSPVVLPTRVPYMQLRIVVPLTQTGLMVGGRVFPADSMILNYALTLSNGRGTAAFGPTSDTLFDTDEHKALGLRLRGTWLHRDSQISLGTYGYVGSERSVKKIVVLSGPITDPEGKVPENRPAITEVRDTHSGHEYVITADFKLDWQGLRLQAEYAWRYWDFSTPEAIWPVLVTAKGGTPLVDQWHEPSHTGYDVYCLIAYALPLQRLIGSFRITPYYLFERSRLIDTEEYEALYMHIGGINMAPWPELVLKLEIMWVIPEAKQLLSERLISLAAQMAVSF